MHWRKLFNSSTPWSHLSAVRKGRQPHSKAEMGLRFCELMQGKLDSTGLGGFVSLQSRYARQDPLPGGEP